MISPASARSNVAGSAASRALIRKVYAEDYALIARHRAALAAEAAYTALGTTCIACHKGYRNAAAQSR